MEHIFTLQGLDCANCAGELERAIAKLSGVQGCRISFLTLKMWVEAEEMSADLVKLIQKTAKKSNGVKVKQA